MILIRQCDTILVRSKGLVVLGKRERERERERKETETRL
jgi:hypothetical protein